MRTYGDKLEEMIKQNSKFLEPYEITGDYIVVIGDNPNGFIIEVEEVLKDSFYGHALTYQQSNVLYPALPIRLLIESDVEKIKMEYDRKQKIN
jgi:hypothetical protein